MKLFAAFFPLVILIIAVLVYFSYFGTGAFFLPTEEVVVPEFTSKNQTGTKSSPSEKPDTVILTLENIFKHPLQIDKGEKITLIATGDVIPARSVNFQTVTRKDFLWPYRNTADVVKDADITFINLETPLIDSCPLTQEGMIFCGSSKNIEGLKFAGVDIASLANNHAGNHGKGGVEETITHLNKFGIKHTGIQGAEYIKIKDTTFAFLGYSDIEKNKIVASAEKELIKKEIEDAHAKADIVIVTYHWGAEYRAQPDESQKTLGRLTIDWGADLVIGNHPHWIQPVEIYKGKLITYAHGNYIFDQEWSQKTKEGVIGRYTFTDKQLTGVEYFPLEIKDYGQATFLEGERKQKILDEMYNQSLVLKRG